MRQWDRALREYLISSHGKKQPPAALRGLIGLRGGGHQASPDCRYMIYVINSARYELARQILADAGFGSYTFYRERHPLLIQIEEKGVVNV